MPGSLGPVDGPPAGRPGTRPGWRRAPPRPWPWRGPPARRGRPRRRAAGRPPGPCRCSRRSRSRGGRPGQERHTWTALSRPDADISLLGSCWAGMAAMYFCTRCGTPRTPDAAACARCGARFGDRFGEPRVDAEPPTRADDFPPPYVEPHPTTWDYGPPGTWLGDSTTASRRLPMPPGFEHGAPPQRLHGYYDRP